MPAPYLVVANDPQIVKHILKDEFNKYSKADTTLDPFFYYFEDFLGEGIFVVKHGLGSKDGGQEWSRMRKVSAQIFTRKNFNSMMQEVFMSKAESLRRSAAPGPCSRCPPKHALPKLAGISWVDGSESRLLWMVQEGCLFSKTTSPGGTCRMTVSLLLRAISAKCGAWNAG